MISGSRTLTTRPQRRSELPLEVGAAEVPENFNSDIISLGSSGGECLAHEVPARGVDAHPVKITSLLCSLLRIETER
jgi:hypothetical protein